MPTIAKDNGDGTVVMKKAVWIIGKVLFPLLIGLSIFAAWGRSWVKAYTNASEKVPIVEKRMSEVEKRVGGLETDVAVIKRDVQWLCKKFGKEE